MNKIFSAIRRKFWLVPLLFVFLYGAVLFHPFFLQGKLPIPADTIVGLYHPWRDFYSGEYPSGIPYKNFLITDPVRQQYLWRQLAIEDIQKGIIPSWNPYSFSGTPLLANLQTAIFYPLNILYLLGDFATVWSLQVILQLLFGGLFMYLYLRHLGLEWEAVTLGVVAWLGSGFVVSWLEWNTIIQSALWLPLILLAVDKIFSFERKWLWTLIFILSLAASFFAGHLQTFFYLFLAANAYLLFRVWQTRQYLTLTIFFISYLLFSILISPQLFPTLSFISQSARNVDQVNWNRPEWFLPWQNLVQIIAPDFFGHPATLNYSGIFSYQEFVSYVGIIPLIFALPMFAWFKNKHVRFFGIVTIISLIFALPTPLAKLPYIWQLPFISSAQPTRLLFLVDFPLAVLAAYGLDQYLKSTIDKKVFWSGLAVFLVLGALFAVSFVSGQTVSYRNLILPLGLAGATIVLLFYRKLLIIGLLLLALFDLSRFAIKFESFSSPDYLFPKTQSLSFLEEKSQNEIFRFAATDDKILPPNFSIAYNLQTVSGYDPLYLGRYGKLIAAIEGNSSSASQNFNRIIVPKNYFSKFFDLLNVKYVVSLTELKSPKLSLVFQEGKTRVYENKAALPRAFFVAKTIGVGSPDESLQKMFAASFNPAQEAVVEISSGKNVWSVGAVSISKYEQNRVIIATNNPQAGFLVLTDAFYPGWQATIDYQPTSIFPTDVAFRGIIVPEGSHEIIFSYP